MMKPMKFVLVEDDTEDAELLQDALEKSGVHFSMALLKDGRTAADFFQCTIEAPDLIIMDFNLPKMHGRDVIPVIRQNPVLADVPLIVLSTSSFQGDIDFALASGANRYLVKPATVEEIQQTAAIICRMAGAASFSEA